jgi:hypothetical protein
MTIKRREFLTGLAAGAVGLLTPRARAEPQRKMIAFSVSFEIKPTQPGDWMLPRGRCYIIGRQCGKTIHYRGATIIPGRPPLLRG